MSFLTSLVLLSFVLTLSINATPAVDLVQHDAHPLISRGLPTGTCNDETPCVNGACCSKVNISQCSEAYPWLWHIY